MYKSISHLSNKLHCDEITTFLQKFDIEVNSFGRWKQTNISKISDIILEDFELIYVRKGQALFELNNTQHIVNAGELILLEPYEPYSASCLNDEKLEYYYIHFDCKPSFLHEDLVYHLKGKDGLVFAGEDAKLASKYFDLLIENQYLMADSMLSLITSINKVLLTTLLHVRGNVYQRPASSKDQRFNYNFKLIKDTLSLVDKNMSDSIKISYLCSELNVSESYLYKTFKKIYNQSPSKFIQEYKLKCACKTLKLGIYTLEEVAQMYGYSSAFHLSNQFKAYVGVSPKEYFKKL